MNRYKPVCLVVLAASFAAHSYGQVWKRYADSAKAYQDQQKMDKAIAFCGKANRALKKDSSGTATYAANCNELGDLYLKKGRYKNAEPFFTEARAVREKILGKSDPAYATSCNDLGLLYFYLGWHEKAEAMYLEAKATQEKAAGRDCLVYAQACNNLAMLYLTTGRYQKAAPLCLEAKTIREETVGKSHPLYAQSCNSLAGLLFFTGWYEKAEQLYLEAKNIREKTLGKNHPDYAASCNGLANLYLKTGKYEEAKPLYLEAKAIREKILGKEQAYASSCNGLASLYLYTGEYEKAERLYLEAKAIQRKVVGKKHPEYAASCNNLAILYLNTGQYEKAEPLYLEAKETRAKAVGKNHPDYAQSCNNLATLYLTMGQYGKAEPLYLEAKAIREKTPGKTHPDYAASCNSLASLYFYTGQYKKAEPLYLEAKAVREKALKKNHPDYAATCNDLANLYMAMERYENAEPLYLEAKAVREKALGKKHPDYAVSCNSLASLYINTGRQEEAKALCLETKEILEKTVGRQHPDYAGSCNNLAGLYWLLHQPLLAEKEFEESFAVNVHNIFSVFQFTNEKEKTAYVKNALGEDDKAYSFYATENKQSGQPYSLSLFHRNLVLSSSQAFKKQVFSSNDVTVRAAYGKWMNFRKALAVLYAKPVGERKHVAEIEEKAEQLEKELIRLSPAFAGQRQKVDWKDIQNKLRTDEAAVEFVSFHLSDGKRYTDTVPYMALLLRKDRPLPLMFPLFNEKQLTDLLSAAGNKTTGDEVRELYGSKGKDRNGGLIAGQSVYDLIWKPLEKELAGIRTVYFAPAGLLHRIAFAALPVTANEVLSDRLNLVQLTTTAAVAGLSNSYVTTADKIQLYGGIRYSADTTALKIAASSFHGKDIGSRSLPDDLTRSGAFDELPYTRKEITGIASLAARCKRKVAVHTGLAATEESLKALDGTASPAALHIATHGFFFSDTKGENKEHRSDERGKAFKLSDDPLMRSGLLFAGANNAWQNKPVAGIDDGVLTGYEVSNLYLPNTKLVVLSACETGLGDIQGSEGVYGLQRAFKMAGVENLVMSLWKVPDAATAEFMLAFYKDLFAGKSIGEAFSMAQTAMKNKYRADPYKWAAWVLVK